MKIPANSSESAVLNQARREEVEALAAMEGMDLADPGVMAGAWRDVLLAMPAGGEDDDFARIQDRGRDLELLSSPGLSTEGVDVGRSERNRRLTG
jgi:hypothetical protein